MILRSKDYVLKIFITRFQFKINLHLLCYKFYSEIMIKFVSFTDDPIFTIIILHHNFYWVFKRNFSENFSCVYARIKFLAQLDDNVMQQIQK